MTAIGRVLLYMPSFWILKAKSLLKSHIGVPNAGFLRNGDLPATAAVPGSYIPIRQKSSTPDFGTSEEQL